MTNSQIILETNTCTLKLRKDEDEEKQVYQSVIVDTDGTFSILFFLHSPVDY